MAAWCEGFDGGVELLMPTEEIANAATSSAIVTARMRRGVSQVRCWVWSHARTPLAPAVAAITHPAHMPAA
jgi:hypothetical protein